METNALLLPKLQSIFPGLQSYEQFGSVTQANAEGYMLKLTFNDGASGPEKVFVKQVEAVQYVKSKKDWADLRRTLLYARTEARFYDKFAGRIDSAPKCYHASYSLDGWISEDDHSTDPVDTFVDKDALPDPQSKGGIIVLDYISPDAHFQDSPLTIEQCKRCLEAIAHLHATGWENSELLTQASKELSKASFHLSTRNPKELDGLEEAWESFITAFQSQLEAANLWTDSVQTMGTRTKTLAQYLSDKVSPAPDDPYATFVHGDYKSMNVFIPKSSTDQAYLVDFASTGVGLGMSDLAMHLHHAVKPEDLDNGGEEVLLRHYLAELRKQIPAEYPDELAMQHYRYACVDYFRFFLGRFWKTATPESMLKKKDSKNTNLINRSPEAAIAFVGRIEKYLVVIEKELDEANKSELK